MAALNRDDCEQTLLDWNSHVGQNIPGFSSCMIITFPASLWQMANALCRSSTGRNMAHPPRRRRHNFRRGSSRTRHRPRQTLRRCSASSTNTRCQQLLLPCTMGGRGLFKNSTVIILLRCPQNFFAILCFLPKSTEVFWRSRHNRERSMLKPHLFGHLGLLGIAA